MTSEKKRATIASIRPEDLILSYSTRKKTKPIWIVREQDKDRALRDLSVEHKNWLEATGWKPRHGAFAQLPGEGGECAGAVFCIGSGEKTDRSALAFGILSKGLPGGVYHFHSNPDDMELAALGWVLGAYNFDPYHTSKNSDHAQLKLPVDCDRGEILNIAEAVYLARDLINTPANDMGPDELEDAARKVAQKFKANMKVIKGEKLLKEDMNLIHAVGRASPREPRLIDLTWGPKSAAKVTIVGKGIVFDTGGLNLKPGNSMTLMKKDMGGAAAALGLGRMIMGAGLNVRLRVLLPTAENAVSGNAFRPGDVIKARNGTTVEIGNTDAEGRLVLADALAYADEETPETIISLATLTGAARVALGPDLPPFYTDDDEFAVQVEDAGLASADPVWRMPFWAPYDKMLASTISDVNHISNGPFAGSITAALFLKRFARNAARYAHFDIYGWTPTSKPGKPKGGEPQAARALLEALKKRHGLRR